MIAHSIINNYYCVLIFILNILGGPLLQISSTSVAMVGQQGKRASRMRASPGTKSHWWRKLYNLNARSRLQEVGGSFNCTEKFSMLVSCHRGYGSVAFYAVFSLFILAFLYAIWKIVSAHSRSGRRPGSGSSTTVTKISPTAHAPTGYVSNTENGFDGFHQRVKNIRPFQGEGPERAPSSGMFSPQENEVRSKIPSTPKNMGFPMTRDSLVGRPSSPWPIGSAGTRITSDYPNLLDTSHTQWSDIPSSSPTGLNPYFQLPFPRESSDVPGLPFSSSGFTPGPYNNINPLKFYNGRGFLLPFPRTNDSLNVPSPSFSPTSKTVPESSYGNSYYGDGDIDNSKERVRTSPSPLISFLSEGPNNEYRSKAHIKDSWRKHEKSYRKTRRHKKKKNSEGRTKGNFARNHHSMYHRQEKRKQKPSHFKKKKHHFKTKSRTENRQLRGHSDKRVGVSSNGHESLRKKEHRVFKGRVADYRSQLHIHPHRKVGNQEKLKLRSYHGSVGRHKPSPDGSGTNVRVSLARHRILNSRLYRIYRRHHSVNEEIQGKWQVSRHHVRTCKLIDHHRTRGTVKVSRTKHKNKGYLHTVLVCRPVTLRLRKKKNPGGRSALRYAQLCQKKWYITKGVIHVRRVSNKGAGIPNYVVYVCAPWYARAKKLLPVEGKGTKVWKITRDVIRDMKRMDHGFENHKHRAYPSKHAHKHVSDKSKSKNEKRKDKGRERATGLKANTKMVDSHHSHRRKKAKGKNHREFDIGKSVKKTAELKGKRKEETGQAKASRKKVSVFAGGKTERYDSDKAFYSKLLKVLRLAKIYSKKNKNRTYDNNIFDSLEAVLIQSQNSIINSTQKTKNSTIKNMTHGETSIKNSSANSFKHKGGLQSREFVQKLLRKLLPVVLKSIHGDGDESKPVTRKLANPTTTPATTRTTPTVRTTPTTSPTQPSRSTIASNSNVETVLKHLLPQLLKKSRQPENHTRQVQKPRRKPIPTTPSAQKSQPKTIIPESTVRRLLARLGLKGLDSNTLTNHILAKVSAVTSKVLAKPTQRQSTISWTSTLSSAPPVRQELTRPAPTFSVTTIEAPSTARQPVSSAQPASLLPQRPSSQGTSQQSTFLPFSPKFTPLSPPHPTISPAVPHPISAAPSYSTQIPINNVNLYPNQASSDPYSRNILCFGDSLTSGYYNHGQAFHPYSQRLGQLLNSDRKLRYYVKTSGKVREMAHGSMAKRLPEVLGNSSRFDWVIILGGTNDVAHVKNFGDDDSFMNQLINVWTPQIVRDIELLHEISHKYGARTVLLTIPESAYEAWPQFKTLWVMRNKLNADLREYALRSQGSVVLCDLATKLPRHSLSPEVQALLWNDHLHLTPYGYDKMAEIVYQCIKPYLN